MLTMFTTSLTASLHRVYAWVQRHAWAQVILGVSFLVLTARAAVPFRPVPMSLQAWGMLVLGYTLPWRRALLSVCTYLVCGIMGLPAFAAGNSGWTYFSGYTMGYLIGFVALATVVSLCVTHMRRPALWRLVAVGFIGQAALYLCGLSWLAHLTSWQVAYATGLAPFALKMLLETIFAASVRYIGQYAARSAYER